MVITDVNTSILRSPLHTPFVTALRRTTTSDSLLVTITDDEGRTGYGEAPQIWQVTGASIPGSQACVEELLAPLLIGQDPRAYVDLIHRVRGAVAGNEAAICAVDVALHDLAARVAGIPLVQLLGGSAATTVETDVTLAAGTVDELAAAAKARAAEGFSVLKAKVGTGTAEQDVARVKAIRDAVGPDVTIRLDANQGWTPREAVRAIRGLEDADLRIELVEQPVRRLDIEGLAWVSDRVELPILADEAVFSVHDLVTVIRHRAADMVNVKLAKCGGLLAAGTLLELAKSEGIATMVGCMMESEIGVGAAASLVAAYGTSVVSDLDAPWWFASSAVRGGMALQSNQIHLADLPGSSVDRILE
ncbi:L-alanine-DL-glutamate epimerase-like enolase superfamily enzyme [Branchiibius hedensis]|uniref:Dipeptide epimerase n=1 Tax=Branchiibius hedensis TaxID=672460 RepID=A0A2Y8ZV38_9MICO|nr:dipeptide epimerase [Branchiibius hedensis]PWJ27103.1 L-alanine-DL-glutamate epimerase-like enolase superfamily enzyme [Branchiibius hedensis]SSA35914.1 L-alanine-DL-glutamate epimerase [Branchiibius hedensis]